LPSISLRVLPEVGRALADYYSMHPDFIWIEDGQPDAKALAAMAELNASDRFGLSPADYRVALPDLQSADGDTQAKTIMRFELNLSAKVLTYVLDARPGAHERHRRRRAAIGGDVDLADLAHRQVGQSVGLVVVEVGVRDLDTRAGNRGGGRSPTSWRAPPGRS
jgi:Scaffold domain